MNEIEQAEQRGRLESKVDSIIADLREIKEHFTTLDKATDVNTNDISTLKGGIKVLWGIVSLIGVLGSGLLIKFLWG